MGSTASLLVLMNLAPAPTGLAGYASLRAAMAQIVAWIFLPSLLATLIAGLLAIAVNRAFHEAGWAWVKAASGIVMFTGGLHAISPIQEEAQLSARTLTEQPDGVASLAPIAGEQGTLWVLLAVSAANVALGVWRPRLIRTPARTASPRSPGGGLPRYW
jgi:hypothetical protein